MKVVIADATLAALPDFLPTHLKDKVDCIFCDEFDETKLGHLLREAEVYVGYRLPAVVAQAAQSLRFVQVSGTGLDQIALEALAPAVIVANTYHHERSIAEHVLLMMLALSRQLLATDARLRRGIWYANFYDSNLPLPNALRGQTVGLIGFGHIGTEVAWLATCFEMKKIVIKLQPDPELLAQHSLEFIGGRQDLPELLRRSDFVIVTTPLTEDTRGMIGSEQLALMKSTAYLINVARAAIIDEAALYTALTEQHIAGAALDVWYNYPTDDRPTWPASFPFHELDNVILTPHISGSTQDTFRRRAQEAASNIERLIAGRPLVNVIRPAASNAPQL